MNVDSKKKPSTSSKFTGETVVVEEEENEPSTSDHRNKKSVEEKPIELQSEGGEMFTGKFMTSEM